MTRTAHDFPDLRFFDLLRQLAAQERELFEKDGYCDSTVAFRMLPGGEAEHTRTFFFRFDDFLCTEVRELSEPEWATLGEAGELDFTLEGSLDSWREMIANIQAHGGADPRHTLNTLALPGVPLRLVAHDPVNADKFYRFNQSYQDFVNLAAKVKGEAS